MEKKSTHILNTSSNLLGFCLIIITSLKIAKLSEGTYLDEFAALASLMLMASCLFSFLSIRAKGDKMTNKYEHIADIFFIIALTSLTVAVVIIVALDLIQK